MYFAKINWVEIYKINSLQNRNKIQVPGKFPGVRRDLAIVVDKTVSWEQVTAALNSQKIPHLQSFDLFDVFENEERIGKAKKS